VSRTAKTPEHRSTLLRTLAVACDAFDTESPSWGTTEAADVHGLMWALVHINPYADLLDLIAASHGWRVGHRRAERESAAALRALELRAMPYRDYLQTPEWIERRDAQAAADGRRCRVCNSPERLQVHHRTYANRGDEQPGDLITLCSGCHKLFHDAGQLAKEPV